MDEAGLVAARHVDRLIAAARAVGADRWVAYFEPMADRLRDDEPRALRQVAMRARAAFGPKDSIRDIVALEITEPFGGDARLHGRDSAAPYGSSRRRTASLKPTSAARCWNSYPSGVWRATPSKRTPSACVA